MKEAKTPVRKINGWRKVKARLERGWTQGFFARNGFNMECEIHSPEAVCWCLIGAIIVENEEASCMSECPIDVVKFNDAHTTTKEDVLKFVDNKIAFWEGQAA